MIENRRKRINLMFHKAATDYKAGNLTGEQYDAEVVHLSGLQAQLEADYKAGLV